MARQDLSTWAGGDGNGYIVEETSSNIVKQATQTSVVEAYARRENMNTSTKLVPLFAGDAPNVYAEGAQIAEGAVTLSSTILEAKKWAKIMHISEEDLNDTFVDVLNQYKTDWATNWARKFDNACLGTADAPNGTTIPYASLYYEILNGETNGFSSNGAVTFAQLNNILGVVETGAYFDPAKTMFIAHPSFKKTLRGLVDDNNRPILQEPLGAGATTLFGYPIVFSFGAATSGEAMATPDGNPFIAVGNMDLLVNGVRAGIESAVSRDAKFDTDGVLLKIRARRAFKVAKPEAFAILEVTAGA